MFLDAHVHLQDIQDAAVRKTILQDAPQTNVGGFFCNAVRPGDWTKINHMAEQYTMVVPFFGIHPWMAGANDPGWEAGLESYLSRPGAGLGEIGLDRTKKEIDFATQIEFFTRQLELAGRLGKPFAVHCVKAWAELFDILKSHTGGSRRWMVHAFSGSPEILSEIIAMGAYVSFSWRQLCRRTGQFEAILKRVPGSRLFIETDFPYLGPSLNAPPTAQDYFARLRETYETAAGSLGLGVEQLEKMVWDNGKTFLS